MTTQVLEQKKQVIPLETVISTNVRLALALRKKNQSDLSRALGVSSGLISQKMHGTTSWTIADMEKAGRYLQIPPARFLEPNWLVSEGMNAAGDSGVSFGTPLIFSFLSARKVFFELAT